MARSMLPAMAVMLLALGLPDAARAQSDPDLTSKLLISILVKKGVLSRAEANSIMQEAQEEARATQVAAPAAPTAPPAPPPPTAVASSSSDGTVHVTYIPPNVQNQIAQQVKNEVLAQEQAQGYARPNQIPDWVHHIQLYGDTRMRFESDMFPSGNDNVDGVTNFNAINTGNPYNVAGTTYPPLLNVDQNRIRFELRARFGMNIDLGDDFTSGIRIATGQTSSPVSENQTIGYANNQQGGNFSKYAVWLDRAWIAYKPNLGPATNLKVEIGRFDNPFFSTPLIWNNDLGFDGIAIMADYKFDNGLTPFLTLGAFPIFNTDFNFSSTQPAKFSSENKYLFGGQAGASYKFNDDYAGKLAVADYLFTNVAGKLSAPCLLEAITDGCSTDDLRPSYAQNGNTYMALRNIIANADNNYGTANQWQYYGLAANFNELALTGEFDVDRFDPADIWIVGEYVRNLAFNKADIASKAVNNRGATASGLGNYEGGPNGYFANVSVGQKILRERWDWNASLGYRYLESDAVVDAFNDSDFGLGGTNVKGYTVGGNLALTRNVWLALHYMSSDSIAGVPYDVDVFQFDLNAKF